MKSLKWFLAAFMIFIFAESVEAKEYLTDDQKIEHVVLDLSDFDVTPTANNFSAKVEKYHKGVLEIAFEVWQLKSFSCDVTLNYTSRTPELNDFPRAREYV